VNQPFRHWHMIHHEGHTGMPEINIENEGDGPVCTIYHIDDDDLANARLIAAAPALQRAAEKIDRTLLEMEVKARRGRSAEAGHVIDALFVSVPKEDLYALREALAGADEQKPVTDTPPPPD
jgi:hypothetical protein